MNTYDTHEPKVRIVPLIPNKEYAESLRAEEERRVLELRNLRAALCEYQLKYWTLAYKTARFSRMMFGDLDDEDWSDEEGDAHGQEG